ncbi:MAG: GAF domain-containing protein [Pyrinomonadaceae bacterium]
MAESVFVSKNASPEARYSELTPQIEALIAGEPDLIANLANVSAALKDAFDFFWVGFYLVKDEGLVLGPFQGPVACTRIGFTDGVCGRAYTTKDTVVVPNVDEFPGHIACSSASKSEIVVPIFGADGTVLGVLDVDSDRLNNFTDADRNGLEGIVRVLERFIQSHTNSERNE